MTPSVPSAASATMNIGRGSKPSSARTGTGALLPQTMLTVLTITDVGILQRGDVSQSDHAPDARCNVTPPPSRCLIRCDSLCAA